MRRMALQHGTASTTAKRALLRQQEREVEDEVSLCARNTRDMVAPAPAFAMAHAIHMRRRRRLYQRQRAAITRMLLFGAAEGDTVRGRYVRAGNAHA